MTAPAHVFENIVPTRQHILNCSYGNWYTKYSKITPKSHVLRDLPQEFINYLLSDGIKMPKDYYEIGGDENSDYSDWEEELENASASKIAAKRIEDDPTVEFKSVHEQSTEIIKTCGPVLPKLNWSAPKDSVWILSTSSMKCESTSDVYLILKSSSYIVHDLTEAFSECEDKHQNIKYDLVLKEWFNLNPAWEFRFFVKERIIVCGCQRDPNYYDYLDEMSEVIKDKVFDFFEVNLKGTFPDENFVFDIYLPEKSGKVWLLDINPFARATDSLLFSWNEILSIKPQTLNNEFELRLISINASSRSRAKAHSDNHLPKDMVDASLDISKMIELMKSSKLQNETDSE